MRWNTSLFWGEGAGIAHYEQCHCKWIFPSSLWWSLRAEPKIPSCCSGWVPLFPLLLSPGATSAFLARTRIFPRGGKIAIITTLDMGMLHWDDSPGHYSSFRESKRNIWNLKAQCIGTWIKCNFLKTAVYTDWWTVARLFSGLAVAPTRKHFGGGLLLSGSISPAEIKALCECAGDSCCL